MTNKYRAPLLIFLCCLIQNNYLFAKEFIDEVPTPTHTPLDCVIEPFLITEVSSSVNGVLQEVYVDKSHIVKKGQKLAKLESSVEQSTVALAKARTKQKEEAQTKRINWNFASSKQKRAEELFKSKAVSSHEIEEAEMNTEIARLEYKRVKALQNISRLELARARSALKLRTIRSPLSGVVIEKYLSPGESVKDRPLFKLAQLDPLRVIVIASTEMFGKIKTGMVADVRTNINPDISLKATVDIVAPVIDAASGTFDIMLSIPNSDHKLPGGLRCKIQFDDLDKSSNGLKK